MPLNPVEHAAGELALIAGIRHPRIGRQDDLLVLVGEDQLGRLFFQTAEPAEDPRLLRLDLLYLFLALGYTVADPERAEREGILAPGSVAGANQVLAMKLQREAQREGRA